MNQRHRCRNRKIARPALFLLLIAASASLVTYSQAPSSAKTSSESLTVPGEKHLGNVRQLTFGGTNAEAYFSADDKSLIFMHSGAGVPCDQMYTMPVDTPDGKPAVPKLVSTGKGRTTCGYFFPKGDRILFSSTHEASAACPPRPDYSHGYVWPIYNSYEIYTAKPDGSDLRRSERILPAATTRNRPSAATARKLSSPRRATAISIFTR